MKVGAAVPRTRVHPSDRRFIGRPDASDSSDMNGQYLADIISLAQALKESSQRQVGMLDMG